MLARSLPSDYFTLFALSVDCLDQVTVMFPDMSRATLQRTFQAWNYDMQRTVTAILGTQEGKKYYKYLLLRPVLLS